MLDLSGSVDATELRQSKNAAIGVVNALEGTPSEIGVFSFASSAPAAGNSNLPATSVATDGAPVRNAIANLRSPTGNDYFTNWDRAFSSVPNGAYDSILFITDGNPTASSDPFDPVDNPQLHLNAGTAAANEDKVAGATVIGVGVGADLNVDNLTYISGPIQNQDYYLASNFSTLATTLQTIALASCRGTVSVVKSVRGQDGTISDGVPEWTFSTSTSSVTPASATTGPTGATNFVVEGFTVGTLSRNVSFAETQKPGYRLAQQSGSNAVCVDLENNRAPVPTVNQGATGWTVAVDAEAVLSCRVLNEELFENPTLTQTTNPRLDRTYAWGLAKAADRTEFSYTPEQPQPVANYTVTATPQGTTDSAWEVRGRITVTNPNRGPMTGTLTTAVSNGGTCTFDGNATRTVTLTPGTTPVDYTCTYASAPTSATGVNTATLTWNQATYAGTSGSARATPNFDFARAAVTDRDRTVTVTDSRRTPATLGSVTWPADGRSPTSFRYAETLSAPPGRCETITNTARIVETGLQRDAIVSVCQNNNPIIELTKQAAPNIDVRVGDTVRYTLVARNEGNVTLRDVTITESIFSGSGTVPAFTCAVAQPATLAPGAETTCFFDYVVTQADVNSGLIENEAITSGTDPLGNRVTADADAIVRPIVSGSIDLVKTAEPATGLVAGNQVTYRMVATNTGTVTLTGVEITEAEFSGVGSPTALQCNRPQPLILEPGQALDCTATYAVQQADVDSGAITNVARVVGTPPSGVPVQDTDDASVIPDETPLIDLVKSVTPADGAVTGTPVEYTFEVTNRGAVTLANVTVAEISFSGTNAMGAMTCTPALGSTLAPGQTMVCTAPYTVSLADVNAGRVTNEAIARGVAPNETAVTDRDDAILNPARSPRITLTKVADPAVGVTVGQEITYTYVATNTGNSTLYDVEVAEDQFSGAGPMSDFTCTPDQQSDLDPNQSITCTTTYVLQQADANAGIVTNRAIATGTGADGQPYTDDADAVVEPVAFPGLTLDKSLTPRGDSTVGDAVTYSFVATNTGAVTLTDVRISETAFSGTGTLSDLQCVQPVTLQPGGTLTCSATYFVTEQDVANRAVTNTATATGTPPRGPALREVDSDTFPTAGRPQIDLIKTASPSDGLRLNDLVTYSFLVTNTGNVTLRDVTLTETDFTGAGDLSALECDPAQPVTLAPNASMTCTATYAMQQDDIDSGTVFNTARVVGTPVVGDPVADEDGTAVTPLQTQSLTVDKTAAPTTGLGLEDPVAYRMVVRNTGPTTLTGVRLTEELFSGVGTLPAPTCTPAQPARLGPDATMTCLTTYLMEQADVDAGDITNVALAQAVGPLGPLEARDDAVVEADQNPAIDMVKTVSPEAGVVAGDTVTYTLTARNSGNVTLTDVTIAEDTFSGSSPFPALSCTPTQPTTLAPNATISCTGTYEVTAADVATGRLANVAVAQGNSPTGPVSDFDDAEVTPITNPRIDLVKSADPVGDVEAGDTVTYTFEATNNGDVDLNNVTIADTAFSGTGDLSDLTCTPQPQPQPTQPVTLAPGASMECTATYQVTEQDVIERAQIANVALASGTPPFSPTPVTDEDDAIVPAAINPAITLDKEANAADPSLGDEVGYTFTATNTGDVVLRNVTISEDSFSGIGAMSDLTCDPVQGSALAPGAAMRCTAAYVIEQGDIDAGPIENVATATGTPPIGAPVSDQDDATVTPNQVQGLDLVKTASPSEDLKVGDEVDYTMVARNTGNTTLTAVTISEESFDGAGDLSDLACDPAQPASLAPDATLTCTATYVVEQADIDDSAGDITNVARATATGPQGPLSDDDDAIVYLDRTPALDLEKTASPTENLKLGDEVTYTLAATNTGQMTLRDVEIREDIFSGAGNLSALSCDPAQPTTLAPGDTLVCTATYVVQQADVNAGEIDNVALVTAPNPTDPEGDPLEEKDGTKVKTDRGQPGLGFRKDASPERGVVAGETVTYTLTATNTGNVTLADVTVDEVEFTGSGELSALDCDRDAPVALAPQQTLTCQATYVVTQQDVARGEITNVALASGTPPGTDTPIRVPGEKTVTPAPQPIPAPPAPPAPPAHPAHLAPPAPKPGLHLAKTGVEALTLGLASALLLTTGGLVTWVTRRRRR